VILGCASVREYTLSEVTTVRHVECRCGDPTLRQLRGDEAEDYSRHLQRLSQGRGQDWLLRCPITRQEWVEDAPLDASAREWVGTLRLRRFPW
jgi:hypothetical protein